MKNGILTILLLTSFLANAQKIGVEYITVVDSTSREHWLIFNKNNTVTISYPNYPGLIIDKEAQIKKPKTFSYVMRNSAIEVNMIGDTSISLNNVERRILNSRFITTVKNQLYDSESGYTYIDKRKANKEALFLFDDGNRQIEIKGNRKFKKLTQRLNLDYYEIIQIRGKGAIDKFGLKGIKGVLIIRKKPKSDTNAPKQTSQKAK